MRRLKGWLVALGIAAAVAVLLGCVLVLPQLLHPPLSAADLQGVANAKERAELQQAQAGLQEDARTALLQSAAGLLLVAGAVATWWQVRISREGQITERFSRAIDHLGSRKLDVRLGGIYALERIAKNSPADRGTVTAVLAAFVRTHAPWQLGSPGEPPHPTPTVDHELPWLEHRATDVQTAVRILGRRPPARDEGRLYLGHIDLRGAYLADARLSGAYIRHSNLAPAYMARAQLDGCDLGDTDLRSANLQGACLTNANLQQAYLQDADLRGADLRGADLRGALLENADFTDVHADATTVWPDDQDRELRGRVQIAADGTESSTAADST